MKTYTHFPSQRPGNQWVGFRLLTAIPEVPVGHNSGENRILTIIVVGVFLVSSKALVWTGRDSTQGDNPHSLVWWEMLWTDAMWPKRLLFSFPLPVPRMSPVRALTVSLVVTWPWVPRWLSEMVTMMSQRRKVSIKHEDIWGLVHQSTLTELTKLVLNRLFP